MNALTILQEKLNDRVANSSIRKLAIISSEIDFCSNDYLGFAKSKELQLSALAKSSNGASGSRLISGNCIEAESAETVIAKFHKVSAALIFSSGYLANIGLISSVASRHDTIIMDEYIHSSIIDGANLSLANNYKFKHNDLVSLEQKIKISKGNIFVIVESVYSMDGDKSPLFEIAELCEKYNANLIVDEAHAVGIFGDSGEGLVCSLNLQDRIFAFIVTYGKAIGLHGAAVLGSAVLKEYLINFSRSFIYTTGLPPYNYALISKAYSLLPTQNRKILFDLINYWNKEKLKYSDLDFIESNTQIQGIMIGDNVKAKALSNYLLSIGINAKAILSPTVPNGKERIRVCLHTYNSNSQIDYFLKETSKFLSI